MRVRLTHILDENAKLEALAKQLKLPPARAEEILNGFDPTRNWEYGNWLVRQLKARDIVAPDDFESVRDTLLKFHRLKRLPAFTGSRNVMDYRTVAELHAVTEDASDVKSRREAEAELRKSGTDRVEVGDLTVWKITTPEAATALTRGCKWCTKDPKWSAPYLKRAPLVMVSRGAERLALIGVRAGYSMEVLDQHNGRLPHDVLESVMYAAATAFPEYLAYDYDYMMASALAKRNGGRVADYSPIIATLEAGGVDPSVLSNLKKFVDALANLTADGQLDLTNVNAVVVGMILKSSLFSGNTRLMKAATEGRLTRFYDDLVAGANPKKAHGNLPLIARLMTVPLFQERARANAQAFADWLPLRYWQDAFAKYLLPNLVPECRKTIAKLLKKKNLYDTPLAHTAEFSQHVWNSPFVQATLRDMEDGVMSGVMAAKDFQHWVPRVFNAIIYPRYDQHSWLNSFKQDDALPGKMGDVARLNNDAKNELWRKFSDAGEWWEKNVSPDERFPVPNDDILDERPSEKMFRYVSRFFDETILSLTQVTTQPTVEREVREELKELGLELPRSFKLIDVAEDARSRFWQYRFELGRVAGFAVPPVPRDTNKDTVVLTLYRTEHGQWWAKVDNQVIGLKGRESWFHRYVESLMGLVESNRLSVMLRHA